MLATKLGREEILDTWTRLGFTNGEEFETYYDDRIANGLSSDDELELLSPENVDLHDFWLLCDERMPRSICNVKSERELDVDTKNFYNWILAETGNLLSRISVQSVMWKEKLAVLEVGAGLGAIGNQLKNICQYFAIDVVPRFEGVIQTDGWTIPENLYDKNIQCVVSSNVFQHFSVEQRRNYYKQVADLLDKNEWHFGYFDFSLQTSGNMNRVVHNNKNYICHMGQYTEIQTMSEVVEDLKKVGIIPHSYGFRFDGFTTFQCSYKRKLDV